MINLFDPATNAAAGPLTVGQVISLYFQLGDKTSSQRARSENIRVLKLFVEHVSDRPASACKKALVSTFLAAHQEWASDWTVMRIVRTIQRPFNWAVDEEIIERNPFKGIRLRQGPRGRPMTMDERQALLRAGNGHFRRFLMGLWLSGARPGELRSLRWEQLDLSRSCAILTSHKTAATRRDRAPRVIVLHPILVRLLIFLRRRHPYSEVCFPNSRGLPWTRVALDLAMWRTRKRAGVAADCKWHSARHHFGVAAATNGVDLATLAMLLGHTTVTMASYYVQLAGEVDHLKASVIKAFKPKE